MINLSDHFEPDLERAAGEVIDGEAIIIDLATGVYYSMRGVGADIWNLLSQRCSGDVIVRRIVESYRVDPSTARADVENIIERLLAAGLIRVSAIARTGVVEPLSAQEPQPYSTPELQAYRDMEDLLALDPPAPGMNQIAWKGDRS